METKIHPLILATKLHKGTQRKEDNKNHFNKNFLEVRYNEPFFQKGFWLPEQACSVFARFHKTPS